MSRWARRMLGDRREHQGQEEMRRIRERSAKHSKWQEEARNEQTPEEFQTGTARQEGQGPGRGTHDSSSETWVLSSSSCTLLDSVCTQRR